MCISVGLDSQQSNKQTTTNSSFGEPRAATGTATRDSVLWALDRNTCRRVLMESVIQKRAKYETFLEEVPLLVSLEPYERPQDCRCVGKCHLC